MASGRAQPIGPRACERDVRAAESSQARSGREPVNRGLGRARICSRGIRSARISARLVRREMRLSRGGWRCGRWCGPPVIEMHEQMAAVMALRTGVGSPAFATASSGVGDVLGEQPASMMGAFIRVRDHCRLAQMHAHRMQGRNQRVRESTIHDVAIIASSRTTHFRCTCGRESRPRRRR